MGLSALIFLYSDLFKVSFKILHTLHCEWVVNKKGSKPHAIITNSTKPSTKKVIPLNAKQIRI